MGELSPQELEVFGELSSLVLLEPLPEGLVESPLELSHRDLPHSLRSPRT